MSRIIWFELKRTFCQFRSYLIILLLVVMSLVMIQDYRSKEKIYEAQDAWQGFFMTKKAEGGLADVKMYRDDKEPFLKENPNLTDEYVDRYEAYMLQLLDEAETVDYNYQKKEWKEYHGKVARYNYVTAYRYLQQHIIDLENGKITNYSNLAQELKDVGKKYQYPDWLASPRRGRSNTEMISNVTIWIQEMRYRHRLAIQEIPSLHRKSVTSLSFLYFFLGELMPYCLPLIIALIVYDTWAKDHKNGSIKVLFTQPQKRSSVVYSKFIVNVMISMLVLILPLGLVFVFLKFNDGYSFWNFPVLMQNDSFSSVRAAENVMHQELLNYGYNTFIGISKVSGVVSGMGIDMKLQFVSLGSFLIMALILLVLFVVFTVAFTMLIASIVRNQYIVFVSSLLMTLLGFLASQSDWSVWSILNPFRYANSIAILGGYASVTALTSVIVLGIYTVILLILNNYFIRRQNI